MTARARFSGVGYHALEKHLDQFVGVSAAASIVFPDLQNISTGFPFLLPLFQNYIS